MHIQINVHTYTENIWLCYKIRAAQTSETQTDNTHQPTVYSSSSHLELGIDIKHWFSAEHAQTLPLCLKKLHETNKSMQITACILNLSYRGHTAQVWPCRFVFLMDYLSSLVTVSHHERHIIHDVLHVTGNMEHMSRLEMEGLSSKITRVVI